MVMEPLRKDIQRELDHLKAMRQASKIKLPEVFTPLDALQKDAERIRKVVEKGEPWLPFLRYFMRIPGKRG